MQNSTHFTEKAESFLGISIQNKETSLTIKRIESYLKDDMPLKALILATANLDIDNWSPEIAKYVSEITNVNLTHDEANRIKWADSDIFIQSYLNNQNEVQLYHNAIKLFVIRPCSDTLTAMFLLHQATSKEKKQLVHELLFFYKSIPQGGKMFYKAFRILADLCKDRTRELSLKLVSQKLIDVKSEKILLSLYWYYSYLEENQITDIIFEVLSDNGFSDDFFSLSSFEMFSWPDFPLENIKNNYNSLRKKDKNYSKNISELNRKIQSLIPICLYAKSLNDPETESFILWNAFEKINSPVILSRLSELSGYEIPSEVFENSTESTIKAVQNNLAECKLMEFSRKYPDDKAEMIKKMYVLQPFNQSLLTVLMNLYIYNSDTEALKMFENSVSRITYESTILALIRSCLTQKFEQGLDLIITRLKFMMANSKFDLGQSKSLFIGIRARAERISLRDSDLVLKALYIYKNYATVTHETRDEEFEIQSKCYKFKSVLHQKEYKPDKRNDCVIKLNAEKEGMKLLKLYDKNSKSFSVDELEILLSVSLKMGLGDYVLRVYGEIAKRDKNRVVAYSILVAPFVGMANRNVREKIVRGTGNLSSRIWQIPAILENPVNREAKSLI